MDKCILFHDESSASLRAGRCFPLESKSLVFERVRPGSEPTTFLESEPLEPWKRILQQNNLAQSADSRRVPAPFIYLPATHPNQQRGYVFFLLDWFASSQPFRRSDRTMGIFKLLIPGSRRTFGLLRRTARSFSAFGSVDTGHFADLTAQESSQILRSRRSPDKAPMHAKSENRATNHQPPCIFLSHDCEATIQRFGSRDFSPRPETK
jgi:hypothetical protein